MAGKGLILCVLLSCAAACGSSTGSLSELKEVRKVQSGTTTVLLLSKDGTVKKGQNDLILEFRGVDGGLMDVGAVMANATMPMAGMAPMIAPAVISPAHEKGRYTVSSTLSMIGTWRFDVKWAGPSGAGTATLLADAQ